MRGWVEIQMLPFPEKQMFHARTPNEMWVQVAQWAVRGLLGFTELLQPRSSSGVGGVMVCKQHLVISVLQGRLSFNPLCDVWFQEK